MPLVLIKSDPRAREKPCLRCGYSLRKIVDARNCPECGLSVWISLNNNDSLDWSRPDWLRMISLGAWVMAAAQALGLLMIVLLLMPWLLGALTSAWVGALFGLAFGAYAVTGRSALFRWGWAFGMMQIVMLIGAVATLLYLRKLAHRLGSPRLGKLFAWLLLIPLLKF